MATLDKKRQLNPSVQGDLIPSLSGKRSHSLGRSDQAEGRGNDWVFNIFTEDDGEAEGDRLPPLKRARSFPSPLKAAENKALPAPALTVKGVQVPGSAHGVRFIRSLASRD
jgi:hypothetical protein